MSNTHKATSKDNPVIYQIRLEGQLSEQWIAWFEGMTITLVDRGDTLITGPVVDQAALHSIFRKVRDLGIPLLSVKRLQPVDNNFRPYAKDERRTTKDE